MRFIHTADIHLGALPDAGRPWSRERGRELWETFRGIIRACHEREADLLLIAGDLFHRPPAEEELREVNYLFSTIPKTRVVLIAGNHDYICPGNAYQTFAWARNVTGLFDRRAECVRFPEIRTEVYGFSYYSREIPEPLYHGLQPVKGNYFQILLAHGGDASHIPVSASSLASSRFDYIALGHIHRPGALIENRAVWSGAPEPIDCADTGPHGYILGEEHRGKLRIGFVPAARRAYRELRLTCRGGDTSYSLADRIRERVQEEGPEDTYRVILTGTRAPGTRFETGKLLRCGRILEVEDATKPDFDLEALRRQYRGKLIGDYIESFDGEEDDPVAEKALMLGLEALLDSQR